MTILLNQHNSKYISMCVLIPKDMYSSHHSSKKLLCAIGHYRKAQRMKIQRTSDLLAPSQNQYIYNITPSLTI